MANKKKLLIPLLSGIILGAGFLIYNYTHVLARGNENSVAVSGNIEVIDAEVSFKINGRVTARLVDEGMTVTAGQEIARLDDAEIQQEVALRKAEMAMAEAALRELEAGTRQEDINQAAAAVQGAQARLDELMAGSRSQEIAGAAAEMDAVKAEEARLKADRDRIHALFLKSGVSAQQNDAANAAYASIKEKRSAMEEKYRLIQEGPRKEQIDQARAALRQAQEKHALAVAGPRKETIDQARARLEQAKASLGLAEVRLSHTRITSPLEGMVLSKNVEPGEYVAPGTPVVTVGNIAHVFLRAYIDESDLGLVKVGQGVDVRTDTYPGKAYPGKVSFISPEAEFTPKSVQTQKERVKLVYRVKIDIENPALELKPGMPADAIIHR